MNRDCTNIFTFTENGSELYRITLINNDGFTWSYKVEELGGGQDISNWALQLCSFANVESSNPTGEVGNPNTPGQGNCLSEFNDIGCFKDAQGIVVDKQIKWEVEGDFATGFFEFTLDQCYEMGCVHVAIKAGNECFCGTILGPTCTLCPPEPGRGILFI